MWTGIVALAIYQVYYLIFHLHESKADIPSLVLTSTLIGAAAILVSSIVGGRLSDILARRRDLLRCRRGYDLRRAQRPLTLAPGLNDGDRRADTG
jgi:hypothetical protein